MTPEMRRKQAAVRRLVPLRDDLAAATPLPPGLRALLPSQEEAREFLVLIAAPCTWCCCRLWLQVEAEGRLGFRCCACWPRLEWSAQLRERLARSYTQYDQASCTNIKGV